MSIKFCQTRIIGVVLLVAGLSLACACTANGQTTSMGRQETTNEYQIGAILWTQSSAEYRALAYQAFTLARLRLDQSGRLNRRPQPRAVIVDIDETVLDNSRFQAELVLRGIPYSAQLWNEWCDRAEAGAVPGAVEFLKYASGRGVHVFYITNRRESEKRGTIANLQRLGFPEVSEKSVMVRQQGSNASKEARRLEVRSRYRVLLLIGDNLNDFNDDFTGKSVSDRKAKVDTERTEFGVHYILLPNPMYGDWENAVNENMTNLTEDKRQKLRLAALKGVTVQPGP
jgi:5'-nucleotidase (lipoprotein e(P4) family)